MFGQVWQPFQVPLSAAKPSLPDGSSQSVEMVLRQGERDRRCGARLAALDVLPVRPFPRAYARRSIRQPPGGLREALQIFGLQPAPDIRRSQASVRLAPVSACEGRPRTLQMVRTGWSRAGPRRRVAAPWMTSHTTAQPAGLGSWVEDAFTSGTECLELCGDSESILVAVNRLLLQQAVHQ